MSKPVRALIVEDSEDDAALLVRELRRGGYDPSFERVQTAAALRKALSVQGWDIILSDYSMPQFNAIDALEVLKATGLDIPFILISGTVGEETAVAAMKAGASDYFLKGNLARLPAAVERELRETEGRREHKRAEDALVKLRKAVDTSGEVVFMTDRDGVITFVNPEFTRLYGYAEAEVVGKVTPRILKSGSIQPEDYANFWSTILDKRVARGEVSNRTKDGRLVSVESSANPILDEHGAIIGFLAIQRDVTARKLLERQFLQAQKMEAVGRLAGGIAHDFNNLLTVINGYSGLLLERLDPQSDDHKSIQEIQKAGERAASLTRQLLAFSRKQILAPQVTDLNAIVSDIEKMLRRLIGEDVEFLTVLRPNLGKVKVDTGQIEQVLTNLVVNARDAMPQGGRITIETADVELDAAYVQTHHAVTPGRYVMLAVSDTGHGMDAETQSHIFEPFFTTKEAGKGTGLGLSTVYGIVKQSGGYVWVYSEPGRGATFKIYLPWATEAGETVKAEKPAERLARGWETILLVEDQPGLRGLAQTVLESAGYRVLVASHPQEAVGICEGEAAPIHLLLTDVVLPGMSGRVLADHIVFSMPEMKVLYMSGYTDNAVVHHGVLKEGMNFLQKPFSPDVLLRKVREALNGKGA